MLNLTDLRVFLAAAETENFAAAGRSLGLTQQAVSQRIRSLEAELGVDLFDRFSRNVALTHAGNTLVPMARDLLQRGHHIRESMEALDRNVAGRLLISCSTSAGKYILPKMLARLCAVHPDLEVDCQVTSRSGAINLLRMGDVQFAMGSLRRPHRGIEYRPFLVNCIVLVAHPQHPWVTAGDPITVADLMEARLISRETDSGSVDAVTKELEHHGYSLSDLPIRSFVGDGEAVHRTVAEGAGLAFVGATMAADAIAEGSIAIVEIEDFNPVAAVYIARDTERRETPNRQAFWEFAFGPATEDIRHREGTLPKPQELQRR